MRRFITTAVLILNGLTVTGCGSHVHGVVRAEAAQFLERLDGGHFEDRPAQWEKSQSGWLHNMQPRLRLGKLVSRSEVRLSDTSRSAPSNSYRYVMIEYNSQFQHGTALEQFYYFVGDNDHVRLDNYQVHVGLMLDCAGWLFPDCRTVEVASGKNINNTAR